jgi:hypothetical protein
MAGSEVNRALPFSSCRSSLRVEESEESQREEFVFSLGIWKKVSSLF